ncbi:MAG TPA: hypothetical protein VMH26_05900 [Burkholderiales bacterium]|nr:hypothetical protein [Burkholderiales bacterium]
MALIKCPDCEGQLSDGAALCPHCGWQKETYLDAQGKVRTVSPWRVSVADVQMPFWSIVKVTVKWVLASTPALVLLVLIVCLGITLLSVIADQLHLRQYLGK